MKNDQFSEEQVPRIKSAVTQGHQIQFTEGDHENIQAISGDDSESNAIFKKVGSQEFLNTHAGGTIAFGQAGALRPNGHFNKNRAGTAGVQR